MEFSDRYTALGIPYPDPATMCHGDCEGTGWYPVYCDDPYPENALWVEAHERGCSVRGRLADLAKNWRDFGFVSNVKWLFRRCDGWHFVKCPDCQGTGRAILKPEARHG